MIKKLVALLLVLILSIESFGAVVSDNDGSAFITKAEFDSLKHNFQSQIDQYNTSIDSKIDGAIASYLAGLSVATEQLRVPLCNNLYEKDITFHGKNDQFGRTRMDTDGIHAYNAYNIFLIVSASIHQNASKRLGTRTIRCELKQNNNKFEFMINGGFDNGKYYLTSWMENAAILWKCVDFFSNYQTKNDIVTRLHFAWVRSGWWYGVVPKTNNAFGVNKSHYYCWPDRNSSAVHYTYDELNVSSAPSWTSGDSYYNEFGWDANTIAEIDSGAYKNSLKHFWVDSTTNPQGGAIQRRIDLNSDDPIVLELFANKQKWDTTNIKDSITGVYYEDKDFLINNGFNVMTEDANIDYYDYYGPTVCGWRAYNTGNASYAQNTALNPNEVYYIGYNGDEYTLASSPIFDVLDTDVNKLSFKIVLKNESSLDDGRIYVTTKKFDTKIPTENVLKLVKNDETAEQDFIDLTRGVEYKITIQDQELLKGTKIYFKIVPNTEAGRVVVDSISDYFITI